ncbi:hypothetical protein AALT_g615 [Alternaria alternata]|nr:hypothetical protein AALT_g615 [Alternaria alternata]
MSPDPITWAARTDRFHTLNRVENPQISLHLISKPYLTVPGYVSFLLTPLLTHILVPQAATSAAYRTRDPSVSLPNFRVPLDPDLRQAHQHIWHPATCQAFWIYPLNFETMYTRYYLIHGEFKQAIQHLVAAKRLNYEFDITFSHGRPYFSLSWVQFAALSPTFNQLLINVDLRTREPLRDGPRESFVPHEHELAHLLEHSPTCFAKQLFDYIAIFLKTLANLLFQGNPHFSVLYTERMILNLRTPTKVVALGGNGHNPITLSRRLRVDQIEARKLHNTMRNTLQTTSNNFKAFDASHCDQLFPLIQIGSLRFATEGQIWGEGHNLVLAHDDFQWLRF